MTIRAVKLGHGAAARRPEWWPACRPRWTKSRAPVLKVSLAVSTECHQCPRSRHFCSQPAIALVLQNSMSIRDALMSILVTGRPRAPSTRLAYRRVRLNSALFVATSRVGL